MVQCLICQAEIPSERGLSNHLHAKHHITREQYKIEYLGWTPDTDDDKIICPLCGNTYRSLTKHLRVSHGLSSDEIKNYELHSKNTKERLSDRGVKGAIAQHTYYKDRSTFSGEEERLNKVRESCSTKEFSGKMSEIATVNWTVDSYREKTTAAITEASNRENVRMKHSILFNDLEYRKMHRK